MDHHHSKYRVPYPLVALVAVLAALFACSPAPPPVTPTAEPTVTATSSPSPTLESTAPPPPTATATQAPPPPVQRVDVLCGDLACDFDFVADITLPGAPVVPELQLRNGWLPVWDANQKRPEYKAVGADEFNHPYYYSDGTVGDADAQMWFCQFAPCDAGIVQTVTTPHPAQCEVRARVSGISSSTDFRRSDIVDDRPNGSQAFNDAVEGSQWYITVNDTVYDAQPNTFYGARESADLNDEATLVARFITSGVDTTIAIRNARLYGERYQNSYVYDVRVWCQADQPTPPPVTPTSTPTLEPTAPPPATATATPPNTLPTPTPSGGNENYTCEQGSPVWMNDWYLIADPAGNRVRATPAVRSDNLTGRIIQRSDTVLVTCLYSVDESERWAKVDINGAERGWVATVYNYIPLAVIDFGPFIPVTPIGGGA